VHIQTLTKKGNILSESTDKWNQFNFEKCAFEVGGQNVKSVRFNL